MSADATDPPAGRYVAEYDPPPPDPEEREPQATPARPQAGHAPDAVRRLSGEHWSPSVLAEAWRIAIRPLAFVLAALYGQTLIPFPVYVQAYEAYVQLALRGIAGLALLAGVWTYVSIRRVHYGFMRNGIDVRLIVRSGVLRRRTTSVELRQVRDVKVEAPLGLRLIGCANLRLNTDDRSDPVLYLRALRRPDDRRELLVSALHAGREARKGREGCVE